MNTDRALFDFFDIDDLAAERCELVNRDRGHIDLEEKPWALENPFGPKV